MSGRLYVVGLGPGPDRWITPEAAEVLGSADVLVGYEPYLARISEERSPARRLASDNRVEIDRARQALECASAGETVAVVSGGDPGIFAMAAAVFEALESGPRAWRALDIRVLPGVTAMLAAAARLGAPLGHDFCAISLSVNLKPWDIIERRLTAAAEADFVIALYNPASKARPDDLDRAFDLLREQKDAATPVAFAAAVGRPDETVTLCRLADAKAAMADMRTLVLIGSSETRLVERPDGFEPFLYTPRTYGRFPR